MIKGPDLQRHDPPAYVEKLEREVERLKDELAALEHVHQATLKALKGDTGGKVGS